MRTTNKRYVILKRGNCVKVILFLSSQLNPEACQPRIFFLAELSFVSSRFLIIVFISGIQNQSNYSSFCFNLPLIVKIHQ
jgi:hypothetical protein